MNIFEFTDYKAFLKAYMANLPKRGRGQSRKLADHLGVSSVVISQVLKADRHFTPEQALLTAQFFALDSLSSNYLIDLVQKARAGTVALTRHYERRLEQLRNESRSLKTKIVEHRNLSDQDKAVFYSNWFYSGVRLLTSIEGLNTVDAISEHFGLNRSSVAEILEFLVTRGLVIEKNGRFEMSVAATFVGAADKFVNGHRRNWRLKGLEKISQPSQEDLFYSSPCTLSIKDRARMREELAKLIESFSKRVANSTPETIVCLNIDWFDF